MKLASISRVGWLIASLLVVAALAVPVSAQEPALTETFDDPALPGWEHSPGVAVVEGVLRVEPGNFCFHGGEWGDFTLTLRARLLPPEVGGDQGGAGEGALVISYRVSDAGAYHVLVEGNRLALQREAGGDVVELAATSLPPDFGGERGGAGKWFQLAVTAASGQLTLALDGEPVLTASDPDPLPPGGLAFETLGELTAELDDLTLTPAGGEAAPTPQATPEAAPPTSQAGSWVRTGGPLGGLGYDIRMRPDNPDVMYVTDAWAGVFKSTDGGQTWFPANNGITTRTGESGDAIPVFCLTIDPHDYDTIWVGTQNVRGIFKSTDGGESWVEMDNGVVEYEGITFRGFTVDPRSSDVVYAAAELSSWAWAGEERTGREFDMTGGVVYKTTDGGQNWTAVWRGDNLARYIWIDPRNPDVVYVSTGIFDREAANSDPAKGLPGGEGVLKSTDGGQTWQPVNNGLGNLYVGSLFMHPQNPDVLLAGTGNNQYYEGAGVYLSTDGGASWQHTLTRDNINAVEFALSNPNIAYAGSANAVYRSEDGGHTWQLVSGGESGWGAPGVRAGFPIDFQVDPRDPNRIFANNYGGGNFLSTDGGRTWGIASKGYTGAQVRDIAVDPTDAGRVYAAARSGLFVSDDGGDEWVGLNYAPAVSLEWYVVAVDPTDPSTGLRAGSRHVLAANNWNGVILQSHDGGQKWEAASSRPADNMSWRAIAFAPSDLKTVYAGTSAFYSAGTFDSRMSAGGVYVSHDGGASWRAANDSTSQDANVTALAVDPRDPQTVYAATGNHGLLKTTDGGGSWTALNEGLPREPVALSVAVHPSEPGIVYVGLERAGLYRSADGGHTWQHASVGLNPEAIVSDVVFDPTDGQTMYLADRLSGVYRSTDGGATWTPINTNLRTRDVNALAISSDGEHLYAATEGEGVFRLDLNGQPPASVATPPTPTFAAATPTSVTAAPTATPTPEGPEPEEGAPKGGICGGAVALPLALAGLIWIRRKSASRFDT